MPNEVKYSTTTPPNSLRKGNVAIGVNSIEMGPTPSTGWNNGLIPSPGNYIIYRTSTSGDPDLFAPQSDQSLYNFVTMQGGGVGDITSVGNALAWIATQSNLLAVNKSLPNIVTDGLVCNLNADNISSYPTVGTSWYDLSGESNNGTLTNGPTFNSNGWVDFDGVDDYSMAIGVGITDYSSSFSMGVIFKVESGAAWSNGYRSNIFGIAGYTAGMYGLFRYSTDLLGMQLRAGNYSINAYCAGNVENVWYYLVSTWDGSILKLYLNGALVDTNTAGGVTGPPDNSNLYIGGRRVFAGAYGNYFEGGINKCEYYDKTLTADEVLQNYHQASIVTDGLVFAVDAGNLISYENGSTTANSLTGSDSGTLTNGVGFDSANGGTWEFDGVNDYMLVSSNGFGTFNSQTYTVDAWVNLNNLGSDNVIFSYDCSSHTYPYYAIQLRVLSTGIVYFSWNISGVIQSLTTTSPLSAGNNYNIVVSFESGNQRIYINGALAASSTNTGVITFYNQETWIGRGNWGGYMDGDISIVRYYNQALTPEEVSQNFRAQYSRFK
tara:strand:- start:251 stop:1897 length:1647 start_codon:yes stop_codon:yes gene_type:complete